MNDKKHINQGDTLRSARLAQDLTQVQLAAKAEISQVYLSDLELGRTRGGLDTWKNLAAALNLSLLDLVI